jgi:hypothetical protein
MRMLCAWPQQGGRACRWLLVSEGPTGSARHQATGLQGLLVDQDGAPAGLEGAGDALRIELGRIVRTLGKLDLLRAGE